MLDKVEEREEALGPDIDSDEYHMLCFCDGTEEGFDELVKRYKDRIVSYIFRHIRDIERSEEIAQEVFIRVFRSRDRYEVKAKFSTFIYRIAMNLAYNEVRDRSRRKTDVIEDFPTLSRDKDNPELIFGKDETERLVLEGINALPRDIEKLSCFATLRTCLINRWAKYLVFLWGQCNPGFREED